MGTVNVSAESFIDIITLENLHKHLYKRINYTLVVMSVNILISTVLLLQRWWVDTYRFVEPQYYLEFFALLVDWKPLLLFCIFIFICSKDFPIYSYLRLWLYFRNIKREMRPKERRTSVNSFVITISLTIARRSNELFYLYRNLCTLLTYLLFYL